MSPRLSTPAVLVLLAAVLAGAPAAAQVFGAAPANGTEAVRPGTPFALDLTLAPVATGEDGPPANEAGCPGVYTLGRPEVNLRVEGAARPLRLFARSSTDTVLMVRTPGGEWLCNDDADGTNPALELDPAAPGLYHVWIGPFFGGTEPTPVTLYASEGGRAALDPAAPPTSGAATLGDFQPDPHEVRVTVGADLAMPEDGCAGFVSSAPTFNLNYTDGGTSPLYVFARADGEDDLTLAVNLPDGSWACNDDADGLNPGLRFERPMAGLYGIWVGSFRSMARTETAPAATLLFSETEGPDPGDMTMMEEDYFEEDYFEGYSGGEDLVRDATPTGGTLAFAGGAPASLAVEAGGPATNSVVGYGCTGFLDPSAPTAWVDFDGGGRLAIWAEAEADATLVVGLPDGTWTCNDDYEGLMPAVVLDDAAPGRYPVWVGTFLDGERQPATLHVSGGEPFGDQ